MIDEDNRNGILKAVDYLLTEINGGNVNEKLKALDRKMEAEFNELKNIISIKLNGQLGGGKSIDDIKRDAYNEAYLAIKSENGEREKEAFNRGVEYGKTLIKNRLDSIERAILREYAATESDSSYNKSITDVLKDILK